MMKHISLLSGAKTRVAALLLALGLTAPLAAQTPQEDFKRDIRLSGSNMLAYPGPTQHALTAPPAGEHPFYISHYGRHGSRFLIYPDQYYRPYKTLLRADSLGKLTPLGHEVVQRLLLLANEAKGRYGELTPLGAEQHRQIARRMFERFPEIFEGKTHIDAKSTIVIRCILSMENELLELTSLNPQLDISHDASEHDMYYMNLTDKQLNAKKMPKASKQALDDFSRKQLNYDQLVCRLFADTVYAHREVDLWRLNDDLFKLASAVQNCESRSKVTLYDLFSDKDILANWRVQNAGWYLGYGNCPLNGGTQPYSQRNLLRRIIEEADSCIRLPHPGATLRFGHETMVLPLVCLMGINGYDRQVDKLDQLEKKGWIGYRVFPMGANVQLVFYRKNPQDEDVLLKVLLNENEAELPVKSDCKPYYHWKDIRDYYLKKLDAYKG